MALSPRERLQVALYLCGDALLFVLLVGGGAWVFWAITGESAGVYAGGTLGLAFFTLVLSRFILGQSWVETVIAVVMMVTLAVLLSLSLLKNFG